MDPDLAELWDDSADRELRTVRHEAAHAAVAILVRGGTQAAPFEYIAVGSVDALVDGIVPGEVKLDSVWFSGLAPLDRAAIMMAGIYAQDGRQYSRQEWRETLDALDGANGVDDYAAVISICRELDEKQASFDELVRQRLEDMQPLLGRLVDEIAAVVKVGERTPAHRVLAVLRDG